MSAYEGLTPAQLMQLSIGLHSLTKPKQLHTYIERVRMYLDGADTIDIPESHRTLHVETNHEGGHRLNVRIRQGAAWLGAAEMRFSVTPGSSKFRDQSEQMEKFARWGERRLARGKELHHWNRETYRDMFECGVSIVQSHPHRGFYVKAQKDRTLMVRGPRIEELFWRRRVDPLYFEWDEDDSGNMGATQISAGREVSEIARVMDKDAFEKIKGSFAWAEGLNDQSFGGANERIETRELWTPDQGVIIVMNEAKQGQVLAADDPRRIIARWRNFYGHVPHYMAAASPWPWTSPLDEMVQLTGLRNYWATMHDYQAAGAIFRNWQLKDTNTGQDIARELWANPVPENVLLDLSKPPPNMGPGTEWVLAPFEMHDVVPRLQMIVAQHEAAGASVARLMGQVINANTAVGTADMMEDYARREFADVVEAIEDQRSRMWEDKFRYIARMHTKEPVVVSARLRDKTQNKFFQTHLELRGTDVVAEDVTATMDTRSRLALIADYRIGREMRTNGDMSFPRAVEQGLVPYVDDAQEEKSDIFIDQVENITMETEILGHQQAVAQNLGLMQNPQVASPKGPNITRGNQTDPRSSGTEAGPDNISGTALAEGASDTVRSA